VKRRRSYAAVTATVALFVSLAVAGYVLVTLGSPEARPVTSGVRAAFGVGLGGGSWVDQGVHRFIDPVRNCRPDANGVAPPCVVPVPIPLVVHRLTAPTSGRLLIFVLAGATDVGPQGETVRVALSADVDGKPFAGQATGEAATDHTGQLAYQSGRRITAGRHTITVRLLATGFEGELRVSPVSMNAVVVDPARARLAR
jgi:hypothetical protein